MENGIKSKKLKNYLNVIRYSYFKNTYYNHRKISSKDIILHHHLGLGDTIICNGLVNFLSSEFKTIHLPVKANLHTQIAFLYSLNKKVKVYIVDNDKEVYRNKKIDILRIGFEKNSGKFNLSFYNQINLPYSYSFEHFNIPEDKVRVNKLYKHLINYYQIKDNYILVHNQSSYGSVELNIKSNLPRIYVDKKTDIFNNLFLYSKLIKNAAEIHCIDSSFLHLVERINTEAELFFHPVKKISHNSEKLELVKLWNIIN